MANLYHGWSCVGFVLLVIVFVTIFTTVNSLPLPVPQQPQAPSPPCTGFLCEFQHINKEIAAAGGDMDKLREIMDRLDALRQRHEQESRDRREKEERQRREREEEQRRRDRERERQYSSSSSSSTKSRGWTSGTYFAVVVAVMVIIGVLGLACIKACGDGSAGTSGQIYQPPGEYAIGGGSALGASATGIRNHDYVRGGFLFPPDPTTATLAITPASGQPFTFTPMGAGTPRASPRPSPSHSPLLPRGDGGAHFSNTAASAPPPEYEEAVNYPEYNPPYNPDSEADPETGGGRRKRIPGPT